ncbi:MAG: sigma-70 family RNA polymerase sigma factor [Planctomycetaceae bacterium]
MPLTEKDRILVNDLLSGIPGAWNSFVDRYANLIAHVIRHTGHAHSLKLNQDDVDDLTADVFTALLERNMGTIRSFRGRCSFATYLAVVVRRITLRKLTQRRYLQAFGHVQAHQAAVAGASDKGQAVSHADQKDEVDSLMSRLPESLRRVLEMFYLDGATYDEISHRAGVPVNSVGPMLSRAKAWLRGSEKPSA